MTNETTIRRAGPRDVNQMVEFFNEVQPDGDPVDRIQVLGSFGEQGYMLAEVDSGLQAIVGWNTEDFIARIRQVLIHPADSQPTVGQQILEEVCQAAHELMCEVALLFPPLELPDPTRVIFESCGFEETALDALIPAWRRAAQASMPPCSFVMVRRLREKRVMRPV